MPARNVVKPYIENSYYHVYNRASYGNKLFATDKDYSYFLHLLKRYLLDSFNPISGLRHTNSLFDQVKLIAYCLMPNHYHLILWQEHKNGVTQLTRRVSTSYALYFNNNNNHKGSIFEGKLRASLINSNIYLLHLSRYIHRNPLALVKNSKELSTYKYSSYSLFLNSKKNTFIFPNIILDQYNNHSGLLNYKSFVEYENEESDILVQGRTF